MPIVAPFSIKSKSRTRFKAAIVTTKRLNAAIGGLGQQVGSGKKKGSFAARHEAGLLTYKVAQGGGGLIGLGKGGPTSGTAGITASTSMVSTGDLFTMMQFGGAAKKQNELGELQGINQGIQDLIKISGGVE